MQKNVQTQWPIALAVTLLVCFSQLGPSTLGVTYLLLLVTEIILRKVMMIS